MMFELKTNYLYSICWYSYIRKSLDMDSPKPGIRPAFVHVSDVPHRILRSSTSSMRHFRIFLQKRENWNRMYCVF